MRSSWAARKVVVVGAGRSGRAASELLLQLGAHVTLTDSRTAGELGASVDDLERLGATLALGGHPPQLWESADAVIASPGIGPSALPLVAARACGVPVLSEIELAAAYAQAPCVAITGSNGKSTVTAMVGAILEKAGLDAPVCGNIGVPLSTVVAAALRGEHRPDRYVLELSSFQTETIERFRPRWSAILNLSADHLDRHSTFESYAEAKLAICTNSTSDDWLIYGADDTYLTNHLPPHPQHVPFSATATVTVPAAWLEGNGVHWRDSAGDTHRVVGTEEMQILGRHNALNAAAATALACLAGASPQDAGTALRNFRGLEHRMELCGTVAGVRCVNDSKATNVGATVAALRGIDDPIWLILGGRDKGADFGELAPHLANVRGVLLVGEATERIAEALPAAVDSMPCDTIDVAVAKALDNAATGEVLLLAPACTSFDQYTDFEARGKHFRALIADRGTPDVAR